MKKILLIGFMVAMLIFPVASWSLTIGDPAIDIGGVDALIASTAIIHNIEIYTLNIKDFKFIKSVSLYKSN